MKVGGVIQYEPEVPYFKHCSYYLHIPHLVIPSSVCWTNTLGSILTHVPHFKEKKK